MHKFNEEAYRHSIEFVYPDSHYCNKTTLDRDEIQTLMDRGLSSISTYGDDLLVVHFHAQKRSKEEIDTLVCKEKQRIKDLNADYRRRLKLRKQLREEADRKQYERLKAKYG